MELKNKNLKLKKFFGNALKFLLVFGLSACASTRPPDVPLCVEFSFDRGRCVHIISGKEFNVNEIEKFQEKTWWEMRPTMVQMPASSWAEIKSYIIKTCKKHNICEKEIQSWDRTIENIDSTLKEKDGY